MRKSLCVFSTEAAVTGLTEQDRCESAGVNRRHGGLTVSPENKGICFILTQYRQVMKFRALSIHTIPLPRLQTMFRVLPSPR